MNLPLELTELVVEKRLHQAISMKYIQELPEKLLKILKTKKWYHVPKYQSYKGFKDEKCCIGLNWALRRGHLDICQWIVNNTDWTFDEWGLNNPQVLAAAGGHIDIMKWLLQRNILPNDYTFDAAAGNGHLHVLIWLKQGGYEGMSLSLIHI